MAEHQFFALCTVRQHIKTCSMLLQTALISRAHTVNNPYICGNQDIQHTSRVSLTIQEFSSVSMHAC